MDLTTLQHNPHLEELTDMLCAKTQNTDKGFFRIEVAYFLAKIASCMRVHIKTNTIGDIPINCYAIALANSGYSKGFSMNIMESSVLKGFQKVFCESTFPQISEISLEKRANEKAANKINGDPEEELRKLQTAFERTGSYVFTFDSGTAPAIKQLRQKLLMAQIGAISLQIDEIGSNLLSSIEVLNTFLELYDQGLLKPKLTKNTNDSIRDEDIIGKTPANLMMFGTPAKLFDGSATEDNFYSLLDTGYARRCIFGLGVNNRNKAYYTQDAQTIYNKLTQPQNQQVIDKYCNLFLSLANAALYNMTIILPESVNVALLDYKIMCEKQADALPEYKDIQKAELSHRYFKALKLAGAFAFIDKSSVITLEYLQQAIKLVEESGQNFNTILNRDKAYMKLAKYLASVGIEQTHPDLAEALPFYKSGNAFRNELMTNAIAWGYKNSIIIKKTFVDGIEFFTGETLQKTDLNKLIISGSTDFASNYQPHLVSLDFMEQKLFTTPNIHWCNHTFSNGHRCNAEVEEPFNMIVLDIDGGTSMDTAQELLKDYNYIMYSTKSSTPEDNRFRLVIPMLYTLKLTPEDYKEFMNNILKWLPFNSDESANKIAQCWNTYSGSDIRRNEGELLDPIQFIPKTSKNEQYLKQYQKIESMDNLERWFMGKIQPGNRNNQLLKFALCLVDSGLLYPEVEARVKNFNSKLLEPLSEEELNNSILVTTAKRYKN